MARLGQELCGGQGGMAQRECCRLSQGWVLVPGLGVAHRGSPDLLGKVPREEMSRLHTPGEDEPGVRGSRGETLRKHWSWPSLCQASAW